jgi:hypothetical protein
MEDGWLTVMLFFNQQGRFSSCVNLATVEAPVAPAKAVSSSAAKFRVYCWVIVLFTLVEFRGKLWS